jgi:hypothetical protein
VGAVKRRELTTYFVNSKNDSKKGEVPESRLKHILDSDRVCSDFFIGRHTTFFAWVVFPFAIVCYRPRVYLATVRILRICVISNLQALRSCKWLGPTHAPTQILS